MTALQAIGAEAINWSRIVRLVVVWMAMCSLLAEQRPSTGVEAPKPYPRFVGKKHSSLPSGFLDRRSNPVDLANPGPLLSELPSGGEPRLPERPHLITGAIPTAVVTEDFNNDGVSDFAVTSGWDNTLWIYLGRAEGGFEPARIRPLKGVSPLDLVAADFNRDGKIDVAIAFTDSNSAGLLLGRGDGSFEPEIVLPLIGSPICLVTADFTGDNELDLAFGLFPEANPELTPNIVVLPGRGDGSFASPVFRESPYPYGTFPVSRLSVADFNHDSQLDLASADPNGDIAAYLNDGSGRMSEGTLVLPTLIFYGNASVDVATGDFDGDGCDDVAGLYELGDIAVRRGRCDGTFEEAVRQGVGSRALAIDSADVDGDDRLDLVVSGSMVSVSKGGGLNGFEPARTYRGEPGLVALATADFNRDGVLDVVSISQRYDLVNLYLSGPDGDFGGAEGVFTGTVGGEKFNIGTGPVRFADVNNDGSTDAVFIHAHPLEPDDIVSLVNDGSGRFASIQRTPTIDLEYIHDLALGDFRNTGHLDLIATSSPIDLSMPGRFLIFAPGMGDGRFGTLRVTPLERGVGPVAVADFNHDGNLDFACAATIPSSAEQMKSLTVYLGNGAGEFSMASVRDIRSGFDLGPVAMQAGHINDDGDIDLLIRFANPDDTSGDIGYVLLGNPDGTFQPARGVVKGELTFAAADVNGDGRLDVVAQKTLTTDYPEETQAQYQILLAQPNGDLERTASYNVEDRAFAPFFDFFQGSESSTWDIYRPVLGDFNGDGTIDIVAYGEDLYGKVFLSFLLGRGDGTFTETPWRYPFGLFDAPQYATDLTGNARAELVVSQRVGLDVIPTETAKAFRIILPTQSIRGVTTEASLFFERSSTSNRTVGVSSSSPLVTVPPTVEVEAGSRVVHFPVQINQGYPWRRAFSIEATMNGETQVAMATQEPPTVAYFPQIGDGRDDTFRFTTTLVLVNTGEPSAARVDFFDRENQPWSVGLNGVGEGSSFFFQLAKGESIALESSGTGELKTGYARVSAFGPVGGTAIFSGYDSPTGILLFEAGVPMSLPQFSGTVLTDFTGSRNSGLAVVNTAYGDLDYSTYSGDATATLRLYDPSFGRLGEEAVDLAAGASFAQFIDELFPGARGGLASGSATVVSDQPLALITLRQSYDSSRRFPETVPTLTAFPVIPNRADRDLSKADTVQLNVFYVPQIGNGEVAGLRFQTSLTLVNTGPPSPVLVEFFDGGGEPLRLDLSGIGTRSSYFLELGAGESVTLKTNGTGPLVSGSARIRGLHGVAAATVFSGLDAASGKILFEAGVPSGDATGHLTVFVDTLGTRDTGLALLNPLPLFPPESPGAAITLRLYDAQFHLLGTRHLQVPDGGRIARYVTDLFAGVEGVQEMQGTLTVESDKPVCAATLRQDAPPNRPFPMAVPTLAAFPVLPGRADFK